MTARVITWDWKEYPDWDVIAAAVRQLSGGQIDLALAETNSDQFALVIADHYLTNNLANSLWEDWREGILNSHHR